MNSEITSGSIQIHSQCQTAVICIFYFGIFQKFRLFTYFCQQFIKFHSVRSCTAFTDVTFYVSSKSCKSKFPLKDISVFRCNITGRNLWLYSVIIIYPAGLRTVIFFTQIFRCKIFCIKFITTFIYDIHEIIRNLYRTTVRIRNL